MKAKTRMIWACGICDIAWDTREEAEWCCSQECENLHVILENRATKDTISQSKLDLRAWC